jgi:hypothetical protein
LTPDVIYLNYNFKIMTNTELTVPTEIWTPQERDFDLGDTIEESRREINTKNPKQLIHGLEKTVKHSEAGVTYAVLKGEDPSNYSDTEALVMFNPFANSATPNMLVRAEFIRLVAEHENVRDDQGKLKPVIMLASPGLFGDRLALSRSEKKQVRSGDLGPAAKELLGAVSAIEYGRVALLGFSQGADMAISGALEAESSNLDLTELSVGDPAQVKERKAYELALDFLKSGSKFQGSIDESAIEAQKTAIGKSSASLARNKDFIRFGVTALTPTNRTIWAALGKNEFESQMNRLINETAAHKIVVGYGGESDISPPSEIEPALTRLHDEVADNRLISVRVNGKTHAWGDQLPLLAKLYMRALV